MGRRRTGTLLTGPGPSVGPGLVRLEAGLWVTAGRAAVVEGPDHLALVDPGDEPWEAIERDLRRVEAETGKPLRWALVTHAHPDHVANLPLLLRDRPGVRVVAHEASPVAADVRVAGEQRLPEVGPGVLAIPTPGHSDRGDDLAFFVPPHTLFSGDLVQPKGETWEEAFYPSPYPYFRDGDAYLGSLGRLERLPVDLLVTGHREIRRGAAARAWVRLTRRAIERLRQEALAWEGDEDPLVAGRDVFRRLCRERGIPAEAIEARLRRTNGPSAFERFDLPGFLWAWEIRSRISEDKGR